jgi:sirohydrochlorin cobaltochelatase
LTIDVLNDRVKQQFPDLEVREAYTSRIVIKRLGDRGIAKQDPLEALQQLKSEGYTHILIQSSTIIDGKEMESLERNADEVRDEFKEIRIGNPLLFDPHDYKAVIAAITKETDKNLGYVLVGHGTYDSTTAQYAMLDYMLKAKGHVLFRRNHRRLSRIY